MMYAVKEMDKTQIELRANSRGQIERRSLDVNEYSDQSCGGEETVRFFDPSHPRTSQGLSLTHKQAWAGPDGSARAHTPPA